MEKDSKNEKKLVSILKMYPVAILALIDAIMVLIPTYLENYIPNIYGNINMTPGQYSEGLAFYGIFSIVANFVGAYLGGKYKGRKLILISLLMQIGIAVWYGSLIFQYTVPPDDPNYGKNILPQWIGILFLYSIAISGLIWGPLWRIIKNYGTENLSGKEKEKRVGFNNGVAGTYEGIFGLIIGSIGALLYALTNSGKIPNLILFGNNVSVGFLVLIAMTLFLTIGSTILTWLFIKPIEDQGQNGFSLKNLAQVIKGWKIWCMGMIIIGVFMLQMELSAYMNYLSNIFLITPALVIAFGLIRTYVMRFLLAGYVGRKSDKAHSYIFILIVGLFIGIILICIAIILPGFGGDKTVDSLDPTKRIILQICAVANLVVLGSLTWVLVTIRWTPIGTELGITNDNYATAIAFLSAMGFSPGLYYKFIKAYIEDHHKTLKIPSNNQSGYILVVDKTGNQLILLTCACIAFAGFIAGLILYIGLYRNSDNFKFRIGKRKSKTIGSDNLDEKLSESSN
ncbi:hypothetical protein [Spiroplasma endosymbiont of Aspidapion aeneum]|uniref:hypothetical protein n=1 Tax=Spiroplasma endosymbiont of Aspidapion aeneum TaxID=3066276 RepID=UPI00313C8230